MHPLSKLTRRGLLGGSAAAAAIAPFVPVLSSHAQADGTPVRVILVYSPSGTVLPRWRPTGTEADWELSEILGDLASHKDDIIVLDGVDDEAAHHLTYHPAQGWGYGGHHAIASLWSGVPAIDLGDDELTGGGQTVDQFLGAQLEGATPFNTLQFGVGHPDGYDWRRRMSYSAPQTPVAPTTDPATMLEQIFGAPELDDEARARRREGRLSVIDSVLEDLGGLEAKLGADDRIKIERHLDAVREMEQQILASSTDCTAPGRAQPADTYPADTASMMDLMVRALACDATRVATFMWGFEASNASFPFLDLQVDDDRYHLLSHAQDPAGMDAFAEVQRWFCQQFSALLDRLEAETLPEGTLLDHTIVVWASPVSVGWNHTSRNLPIVLGGRGGGYFTTGRYHRWGDLPGDTNTHLYHGGRTMNDLLLSIVHAAGLDHVETFGDAAYCTGPLL